MSTDLCIKRATRLFATRRAEMRSERLRSALAINGQANLNGMFHSSVRLQRLEELYQAELRKSADAALSTLQVTHKAVGSDLGEAMRQAHKVWMVDTIRSLQQELKGELAGEVAKSQLGKPWIDENLSDTVDLELQRHDVVIDNYFDGMKNAPKTGQITINAQTIGAVVTGDHAVVHVKQNTEAVRQLASALETIRQAIPHSELAPRAKEDLMEIVADADRELAKPEPNETKLLTFFTVLAQSVEGIASAKPAYEAIQSVLATFGVNL